MKSTQQISKSSIPLNLNQGIEAKLLNQNLLDQTPGAEPEKDVTSYSSLKNQFPVENFALKMNIFEGNGLEMAEDPCQPEAEQVSGPENEQSAVSCQDGKETKKYFNRSSNNSHKKYAACAKKILFKFLKTSQKNKITQTYNSYKSSRIYYFCILIQVWIQLESSDFKKFSRLFVKQVKQRIIKYQNEADNTTNQRLQKFRAEEVEDIKIALLAYRIFFTRSIQEGIQCLYKKSKGQILKLPEYQRSVMIINDIRKKHQTKEYKFDVEKFVNGELNKKIKEIVLEFPNDPQYIPIFKAERRNLSRQICQHKTPMTPIVPEILKKESAQAIRQEKLAEIQKANRKTADCDQEEDQGEDRPNFGNQMMMMQGSNYMSSYPQPSFSQPDYMQMGMMFPPSSFMNPYQFQQIPPNMLSMNMFPPPIFEQPSQMDGINMFQFSNSMFNPMNEFSSASIEGNQEKN